MADEQVTPAPAAAPTVVSSPLSSPAPSPSAPAPSVTPAVAESDPTPASPATTPQTTRPDGIPDSYWDATANALKVDPAALARDLKERDELKTFKAAEDIKAAQRPKTADEYKLELPKDFKPPAGTEFKLDDKNPALGQLKAVAHKHGLSQDAVNELIGVYAGDKVGAEATIASARAAEIAKLGSTAEARVDAVLRWMTGMDPSTDKRDAKALASMMVNAPIVEAFERVITRLTSQGAAGFSQQHRVAPDGDKIPGFDKMNFAEQRLAQDQLRARKSA